jgi:iron complex transport system ATP-binding protein
MEQLNNAITVSDLSFSYNGASVLDNVSVDIKSEKLTFILGQNGSGKSTLLKILAGLITAERGVIKILNNDSSQLSFYTRSRLTGFLNQQHKAIFPFSVEDVVLTGRAGYIKYLPKKVDSTAAKEAMKKAGILHLKGRNYSELSGGEQQIVMIARLLAQNPKVLLLDEPTTHLDISNQAHILKLLKDLVGEGMTIVAVMHDPNLAFLFGDDFIFVKNRNVIRSGKAVNAWDADFLKTIYDGNIMAIPFKGRALFIPDLN